MKRLCELFDASEVLEGFTIKGGSERDGILLAITGDKETAAGKEVKKWLRKIKIPE